MESAKAPHVKKVKKKQVKDELDRLKQAEKKRRRLEKALATSAAIRSELEKKKQKKKEEQQRLDEEGAAIAEAVALHVLLEEDSDDTSRIVLKKDDDFDHWEGTTSIELFMNRPVFPPQNFRRCSFESLGHFPSIYGAGSEWNQHHFGENNPSFSSCLPYLGEGTWSSHDVSAGLIAAQAVSSLQLGDDGQVDTGYFERY